MQIRHLSKYSKLWPLITRKSRDLTRDFLDTTMASPIGCLTTPDHPEYVEIRIRRFEALAKVKKLRDRGSGGEQKEITDMFLATAGCKAIQKVSTMVDPRNQEELTFKEIGKVIKRNIRPKKRLVIAERTKVSGNKTTPRWVYCTIRTLIERKSLIFRIWKTCVTAK